MEIQAISHRKKVCITLSIKVNKTKLVSGNSLKKKFWELSIIKGAKGLFRLLPRSKMPKLDKLAPRNALHAAKNRFHSLIMWYLRSLESVSILICAYSAVRRNLFKKACRTAFLNRSKAVFLSWVIFQTRYVQTRSLNTLVDFFQSHVRKHKNSLK